MTVLTMNNQTFDERNFEPRDSLLFKQDSLLLSPRSGAHPMKLPFLEEAAETANIKECMFGALDEALNILDEDDDECTFVTETQGKPLHEKQQRSNNKKSVKFADYDDVYEIQHIDDITDEELNALYLSADERKAIQLDCLSIVHKVDNCDIGFDDTTHCVRGLEFQTAEYIKWRKGIQKQLYAVVFEAQAFNSQGIIRCTPELISELCQEYSSESVEAATIFGLCDALHR